MNYQELKNELIIICATSTTLQFDEEIKKFIGRKIEINAIKIHDIKYNKIEITDEFDKTQLDNYTQIEFNSDKFKNHIQTFRIGEDVKIIVDIKSISYARYPIRSYYTFDLVSIEKIIPA